MPQNCSVFGDNEEWEGPGLPFGCRQEAAEAPPPPVSGLGHLEDPGVLDPTLQGLQRETPGLVGGFPLGLLAGLPKAPLTVREDGGWLSPGPGCTLVSKLDLGRLRVDL